MTGIRFLSFSYTVNTACYGDVYYDLKRENEQYTVQICPDGVPSEKAFRCQADAHFAEEIAALLRQYKVSQWNGFHKVNKRILDGRSFTLAVHFENGKEIHAHGYMRYPKNYREFRDAIDACFMRLYVPQE